MKNILVFGDSNAWGFIPVEQCRYPENVRWPGVAQEILGGEYHIIEDNIPGRTSVYDDPCLNYMKGADNLRYSLLAHGPLDLVILAVGTNDLKFGPVERSAKGVEFLIRLIRNADAALNSFAPIFPKGTKILLASPIRIGENLINLDPCSTLAHGHDDSTRFAEHFARVAEAWGTEFIDCAKYGVPSDRDCVHMEPESHAAIGKAMAEKIKEILG